MNIAPESDRLIRVEEKQKAMTVNIASLRKAIEDNTTLTAQIKMTLDELTGAKKFLMWLTGVVVGIGTAVLIYIGGRHK